MIAGILSVVFVLEQLYDAHSTYEDMVSGKGREANSWLEKLRLWIADQSQGGPWLWLVIAKIVALLAIGAGWAFDAWSGVTGILALAALDLVYAYYLYKNYKVGE